MSDRNTIIQALEICASGVTSCHKCPMKDKCKGTANAAMATAIELLKDDELELRSLGESLNIAVELNRKLMKKITGRVEHDG